MKILVISQYYYPEPFRITDICESLVKKGHRVTVLTGNPNYPDGFIYQGYENKYSFEVINGVNVIRSKIYPRKKGNVNLFLNYISFPIKTRKLVKKIDKDFDVVFVNQLSPVMSAIPGIKYAKKNNKKICLYCLDLWPESLVSGGIKENGIIYKFFNKIAKKIYKKMDKILISSKSFADKFAEYNIETKYLPQYAEEGFTFISEERKKDGFFQVVFAGNIGEMQSVETIILAANELKNYKNIIFNIYGSGSNYDNIYKLKEDLGLNNVLIHGRKDISEMPSIYFHSDVMLVTLKKDDLISKTLPGKVQTYMAARRPIIGAIDGETKEIIKEAQAGYVCEAENYKELSKLILFASKDENLIKKGNNGRKYYDENFAKEKVLDRLEAILLEVCDV